MVWREKKKPHIFIKSKSSMQYKPALVQPERNFLDYEKKIFSDSVKTQKKCKKCQEYFYLVLKQFTPIMKNTYT